jgi:imidazolonepropionase-like amidohydrolase
MQSKISAVLSLMVGLLILSGRVSAHHSQAGLDEDNLVTLKGTVTQFEFINPHVLLHVDVKDEKSSDLARLFIKNGTWQVPTLVSQRVLADLGDRSFEEDTCLAYVSSADRNAWSSAHEGSMRSNQPEYRAERHAGFREELTIVGEFHRAGAPFLAGTDTGGPPYTYPGFSLHDELAFLVQAGFTPMEALQAATWKPAQFLGLAERFGTIARGKQVDLVLLDENPLDDIHNTRKIRAVVVQGRYFDRATLDQLLMRAKSAQDR